MLDLTVIDKPIPFPRENWLLVVMDIMCWFSSLSSAFWTSKTP